MKKKQVLIQINSTYDFYTFLAIINESKGNFVLNLLGPKEIINNSPKKFLRRFNHIYKYNPNLKNLLSIHSLVETIKLSLWCIKNKKNFSLVCVGAYRNEVTSILAKFFVKNSKFIAIKQGIDIPKDKYEEFRNLRTLHDYIYFKIFGYSSFERERLKPIYKNSYKSDYFFSMIRWINDPFKKENIYTVGLETNNLSDDRKLILPDYRSLFKDKKEFTKSILLIGERTPMTPYWNNTQDSILRRIFKLFLKKYSGYQFYLRPRLKLTNNDFYKILDPIILDPHQSFDEQLNQLKPSLVISVKSTASKVAAYYGFNSIILYNLLKLKEKELLHLNYLFGDGSPAIIVKNEQHLKTKNFACNSKKSLEKNDFIKLNDFLKLNMR